MLYDIFSHRYGYEIIQNFEKTRYIFQQFCKTLENISDREIINLFEQRKEEGKNDKSISHVINYLIKKHLVSLGWKTESPIFKDKKINSNTSDWRLDFVYPELFSVEIAFNHASATTVNLLKPVLASELNHVEKAFQTQFGIIVTVTKDMKKAGGFDNAIGTFESYCLHTIPLMNQLTVPLIIIGLQKPESFFINHKKIGNRQIGFINSIYQDKKEH